MATELYQLAVSGNHNNEYWENVLYMQGDNLTLDDVVVNAQDLLDSFDTNIKGPWLALLPPSCYINRLTARRVSPAGGCGIVKQYDLYTEAGTAADNAQSNQLCPIVRLIPPMGVKSAGRFFLAAIAEADIQNNVPVAGWYTRLGTLMTALMADFGTGTIQWQIAVYSRLLNTYSHAMDYDTSPIIGWQRGRQKPY